MRRSDYRFRHHQRASLAGQFWCLIHVRQLLLTKAKVMWLRATYFSSLLFAALALAPAMAHLLELPNKINLSREAYLTVQQIYRGWVLLGFVVAGALLSTLALTITVRQERGAFIFALIAFLCI